MTDTSDRMRIVVYYGIWATMCATAAGLVMSLIHTWFFSYVPTRTLFVQTLIGGIAATVAIAAGQGAVALVTGSLLAQLGRSLKYTVLLGLIIGIFDFVMYFVQMAVPATELDWVPDLAILTAVTILITVLGSKKEVASVQ